MQSEKVPAVFSPFVPEGFQVNPMFVLNADCGAVHHNFEPELEEHGSEEEYCAGHLTRVEAVAKVEGEAVFTHDNVRQTGMMRTGMMSC